MSCDHRHRRRGNGRSAGLPKRVKLPKFILQVASGETLSILKEALVTLTMGWRPLTTWVLVADITDEFVLAFNVLRAHSASVELKRLMLQMRRGEVSLQRPEARPRSHPAARGDSDVAVARCGRVAAVGLKGSVQMGVASL